MASFPARRRPRASLRATRQRTAAAMADQLLLESIDQDRANVTGKPAGNARPQFYGLPRAAANAAEALEVLEAEAKKRGLL